MQQYIELLKAIKEKGTLKSAARAGMPGTISLFGYQFRHSLADGFPAITTKPLYWKGVVYELLWFLQGDTNIKYLDQHGVRSMWHEDAYNYYVKIASKNTDASWNNIYMPCSNRESKRNPADESTIDSYSMFTFEEFCAIIAEYDMDHLKEHFSAHGYTLGDCGKQYGWLWRRWETQKQELYHDKEKYPSGEWRWKTRYKIVDQIIELIEGLRKAPMGRRHIITAWNPVTLNDMALNACHAFVQFNCRPLDLRKRKDICEGTSRINWSDIEDPIEYLDERGVPRYYLDCQLTQRSADVVLGVPLNIASYSLLTHILAKICNMIPGDYIHSFGDVHIYEDHMPAVDEQLEREPKQLPTLNIKDEGNDWAAIANLDFNLIGMLDHTDFALIGYDPHPKLKSPTKLSTGLK